MNINELLAAIDNTRRQYGQNVLAVVQNPAEAFQNSLARYAQENLPTPAERQDAMSVMPGMGDAMMQKVNALAMNSFNPAMTVWHGSPHLFDKFDISKIGTGEGAQVFGHGLYVAENPNVAGGYRTALADTEMHDAKGNVVWKAKKGPPDPWDMPEYLAGRALEYAHDVQSSAPYQLAAQTIRDDLKAGGNVHNNMGALNILGNWQESGVVPKKSGALYKVDLPDEHIAKMLDWDKPLSEQAPEVQALIQKAADIRNRQTGNAFAPLKPDISGETLVRTIGEGRLHEAGIPGIKYLDQGSRGASGTGKWKVTYKDGSSHIYDFKPNDDALKQMGATAEEQGTRNFVVFDDKLLKILGRE